MRRTQVYLDDAQTVQLDRCAAQEKRTRSELIRTAIDAYLESKDEETRLRRFRETVLSVAGIAPDFDVEGVESMRRADRERLADAARALSD